MTSTTLLALTGLVLFYQSIGQEIPVEIPSFSYKWLVVNIGLNDFLCCFVNDTLVG